MKKKSPRYKAFKARLRANRSKDMTSRRWMKSSRKKRGQYYNTNIGELTASYGRKNNWYKKEEANNGR